MTTETSATQHPSGQPLHVLIEAWSADLRMGATNDPLDLAEYGRASGLRVTICGPSAPEYRARVARVGAEWIPYSSAVYSRRRLLGYGWSLLQAVGVLRRVRPDVVHVNYSGWGPSLACAAYLLGVPVVGRPGTYSIANPSNRWLTGYVAITEAHAASIYASPLADRVQTVGPFISVRRLSTLDDGTGISSPIPVHNRRGCRFLYLGQLVPRKGIDVLMRAFAQADVDGELLLVGGDWASPGYAQELKSLAHNLGLDGRVAMLNHRDDVGDLLRATDVFVLPSHAEAIPRCVLEAMFLGTPVISTRVGGIPTVVTNEETGLLVEPGDTDALAKAIERLAADAHFRDILGSNARTWASKAIDPALTARRYMDAYRHFIDSCRSA